MLMVVAAVTGVCVGQKEPDQLHESLQLNTSPAREYDTNMQYVQ